MFDFAGWGPYKRAFELTWKDSGENLNIGAACNGCDDDIDGWLPPPRANSDGVVLLFGDET